MKTIKYLIFSLALLAPFTIQAQEPAPAPAAEQPAAAAEAPKPDAAPAAEAANDDKEQPSAGKKLVDSVGEKLTEKGEAMTAEEEATAPTDLLTDATKVYSDWKTGGWMAGLLALVSLLMNLLRFGPINDFFRSKQIMWLKPILAAVFGAVGGGLTAGIAGAGVGPALISGVMAGLGAIGLYEVTKRRKAENRAK